MAGEPLTTKTNYYTMLTYNKQNLKLTGKQERPVAAMFINGSELNEQSL
jgi:hypothetical protein